MKLCPETCRQCRFCLLTEGYDGVVSYIPPTVRCLIDSMADQYKGEDTPSCKAGIRLDDE